MSDRDRWLLLLAKFQAGQCSAEELTELRRLTSGDLERIRLLDETRPWLLSGFEPSPQVTATQAADLEKLMSSFRNEQQNARASERAVPVETPAVGPTAVPLPAVARSHRAFSLAAPASERPVARWSGVAAAVVFAVGVSVWALGGRSVLRGDGPMLSRSYATARGERREVVLPDSSRVVLAPDTRLAYVGAAYRGPRAVSLEGEAYVDVRHDARRPFVVRTRGVVTRDIGTAFTVRAFAGEPVTVAVESGRVSVEADAAATGRMQRPVTLVAGQLGRVDANGIDLVDHADLSGFFSWESGVLSYNRVPLRQIVADLGRAYDLDITIPDATLANRLLVVTIRGLSADDALTAVTEPLGLRYTRHGHTVAVLRR